MNVNERLLKMATASADVLARVDHVLLGTDGGTIGKQDEDTRLITITEAARRLNLSRPTVYRLTKLGRLDVVPLEGVNRVRLQSVVDYANGRRSA